MHTVFQLISGAKLITFSKIIATKAKFFLSFFLLISHFSIYPQFYTEFSSADALNLWSGDKEKFIPADFYGLKLYDPQFATKAVKVDQYMANLTTPYSVAESNEWEFALFFSFNPSAYNYARIYLYGDNENLYESKNALYLLFGGSNDEISLNYIENGVSTKMICANKVLNYSYSFIEVQVKRENGTDWTMTYDVNDGDESGVLEKNAEIEFPESPVLGIFCNYTKTNNGKYYFSKMSSVKTGELPIVDGGESKDESKDKDNTTENNQGQTGGVDINTEDKDNNKDISDEIKEERSYPLERGDLIISEIMANPKNAASLPEVEYIEILNRTETDFSLDGTAFFYDLKNYILPDSVIKAGDYKILLKTQYATLMPDQGCIIPVSNFPVIANAGKHIGLISIEGDTIHNVNYSDKWYGDTSKKNGGYSLEMMDIDDYEDGIDNWTASNDPSGGTPGFMNSAVASGNNLSYDIEDDADKSGIWVINRKLSLRNDLESSVLAFAYRFEEENNKVDIRLFDNNGYMFCRLANNLLIEDKEGILSWQDEWRTSQSEKPGIIILRIETISPQGKIHRKKEVLVLTP